MSDSYRLDQGFALKCFMLYVVNAVHEREPLFSTAKKVAKNAAPGQALVSLKTRPNHGRPRRVPNTAGPKTASLRFYPD